MNKISVALPAVVLGFAALAYGQAQTPAKIGIIHVQNAILSTKDGQKAASELQTRFAPKKAELDKKQSTISALQDQYRKGSATMSDEAKQKLMRDIDQSNKALTRETEDAQAELDTEQGKLMQDLGQKMMAVLDKYAKDNGFAVILDVSNPQTPVLWASNGVDITNDIVALYDKSSASAAPASAPAPATRPSVQPAVRPPSGAPATAPPVTKKKQP